MDYEADLGEEDPADWVDDDEAGTEGVGRASGSAGSGGHDAMVRDTVVTYDDREDEQLRSGGVEYARPAHPRSYVPTSERCVLPDFVNKQEPPAFSPIEGRQDEFEDAYVVVPPDFSGTDPHKKKFVWKKGHNKNGQYWWKRWLSNE